MEIRCREEGGVITLLLKGRLGVLEAAELEAKLKEIGSHVMNALIFDCSELVYTSSAGLRVFLMWARQQRKAGKAFKLINVNNDVFKILTLSGFTNIIDCSRQEG